MTGGGLLAFDSDLLGLQFLRGMVAAVNPCGFVLLPTYLLYFLGIEASGGSTDQRASVRRALVVGSAVSAGFVAVFVVIGIITEFLTRSLLENAKYVTVVIGVAFVVLGVAILAGFRPNFATPHVRGGGRTRSVSSMFVYGVAYAVASLGCTMPLFLTSVIRARSDEGFVRGVVNVSLYGVGMGLIVVALTVSLAFANQALLRLLRSAMRYVDQLAAAFMVVSGVYLIYYFFVIDLGDLGARDPIIDGVRSWQSRVVDRLIGGWEIVAVVLVAVVAGAALYAMRRPSVQSPSDDV